MRQSVQEREDSARSSSDTVSTPEGRRRSSANSNDLSAEFVLGALAKGDKTFIEMGKEEENRRHREIQKALTRQDVELNQLNLRELELSGRDQEMTVLMEAFHEVHTSSSRQKVRIVNVRGKAGTGKTRLCQEFKRRVRWKKGFFLTGKFDLQNRQEPYAGISMALAELPAQFLELEDDARFSIQERIEDAIGEERTLLESLVPNLSQLLPKLDGGKSTRNPEPDDNYATRSVRLLVAVQHFLEALCIPEHYLVVFLDDMQWSDEQSLSLISNLTTASALSSFLLVTTCREEKVDESTPFIRHMNEISDN
jgi:predicted ATPase